jgi:hypothetical protein
MRTSRFRIVFAVALLLVGISVSLLVQEQKSPSHEEHAKAVNLVRLINAAKLWYNRGTRTESGAIDAHGRYASWDELNNGGALKTVQGQMTMVKDLQNSAGPKVMEGIASICSFLPTGNRTPLRCIDTRDGDGLFPVFSDQNGIIFLGSPL